MSSVFPRPFRYLRDPLFLFCVGLYLLNRLLFKPLFPAGFHHNYLSDLICIPFWVPIMLWGMRRLGWRGHDLPPQWYELLIPLLVWSYIFESWLPKTVWFQGLAVADYADILWYAAGALLATEFWRFWYRPEFLSDGSADN